VIEINGAYGEGGGQILRTAVSLSAVTMTPVRIYDIRAGRSPPAALLAPSEVVFDLTGGTDVAWSPPIDYMRYVFVPMIKRMGADVAIQMRRRGHYPRGGGRVRCVVQPLQELVPLRLEELGGIERVDGVSHCVRLPAHVAKRQAEAAHRVLDQYGIESASIQVETYARENDPHRGPGSGIVLWATGSTGAIVGADALGERGKRAEEVGEEAAKKLVNYVSQGKALDPNLSDMMVPYMALAKGRSVVGTSEVTSHLRTNIWVCLLYTSPSPRD